MDAKKIITREELFDYMHDRCSKEQARQVRMWLMENLNDPANDQLFSDLLDAAEVEYDPAGKERVRRRLLSVTAACTVPEHRRRIRRWRTLTIRLAECAAVAACLVAAFHYRRQANTPREWVEAYAALGERREVVLPDSSRVWLNAGSKLIYPRTFNRTLRQVYLSGEMFADVRPDADRPFIVSAERLEVKVLGTRFNLKAYQEDDKLEVSLVQGSVSVGIRAAKMDGRLKLSPGDMLRFNKSNNHLDVLNFNPGAYRNWTDNDSFYFVEQSLGDIVADLHRHFDVDIIVTDRALCDETYYASFINDETLDQILEALNRDRQFTVRKENAVYYLSPPAD